MLSISFSDEDDNEITTARMRDSSCSDGSEYVPSSESGSDEEPEVCDSLNRKKRSSKKSSELGTDRHGSGSENVPSGSGSKSDEELGMDRHKRVSVQSVSISKVVPEANDTDIIRLSESTNGEKPSKIAHDDDTGRAPSDFILGEVDVKRFSDAKHCWYRKIVKSTTTKTGKPKKTPRVYNSYQWCDFCKKKVSNWSQHIDRRHKHEIENEWNEYKGRYKHLGGIDIDGKEAHKIKTLIRYEHNHRYNLQSVSLGGEVFLERRTAEDEDENSDVCLKDFGPCHRCKTWTKKQQLWRHQRTCICTNTTPDSDSTSLPSAQLSTLSDIISHRMSNDCQMLTKEVLNKLRTDEVGEIVRSDFIILKLGKMWITKNVGNILKRGKYTSQVLRLVGHFLKHYRKITDSPSATLWQALRSQNYHNIVYAVITTATHDLENVDELKAPSNSIKMGFEIKRAIAVKVAESILSNDPASRDDAEALLKVVNIYWTTDVTKLARHVLLDRQFNKVTLLPDPRDVAKFNDSLNKWSSQADTTDTNPENYKKIAEICAAKITLYNRRRPGEVENLT